MNQDIVEEKNAAKTIISHLQGKPIQETSGDEHHRLNPIDVEFKVGLTESGDKLSITITQGDRHHPHLVYDTIKTNLSEIDELKNYHTLPLNPEKDYDQSTGKITLHYEISKGVADSIIHKLSDKSQKLEQTNIANVDSQAINTVVAKVIDYFNQNQQGQNNRLQM